MCRFLSAIIVVSIVGVVVLGCEKQKVDGATPAAESPTTPAAEESPAVAPVAEEKPSAVNAQGELARTQAELARAQAELELAKVKAELQATNEKLAAAQEAPSAAEPGKVSPIPEPPAPEPVVPIPPVPASEVARAPESPPAVDEEDEGISPEEEAAMEEGGYDEENRWEVFRTYLDVDDPFLNMRAGTSPSTELLGQLPDGTAVEYLGDDEEFRHVEVLEGPYAGKVGYVHRCCVKPVGSRDLYFARLSEIDHFNGHGVRLASARGVVRQERANFHMIGGPDIDDGHDLTFHDGKARGWLEDVLDKQRMGDGVRKAIMNGTPLVQVTIWPDSADVQILRDEMWRRDKKLDGWRLRFRSCLSELKRRGGNWEAGWRACGGMKDSRPRDRKRDRSDQTTCRKLYKVCPAAKNDCQRALGLCLSDGYFDPWFTGY